jgi:hypothetical protein
MKTFKEFLIEANTTQRLAARALELVKVHRNDPEKFKVYLNLLKKAQKRSSTDEEEYPGRTAARRDKYLIPSHRTSSFPELAGTSTITKNLKKLRKQRALGEIS